MMKTKFSPFEIYQNACNRGTGCLFCSPVEGMPIEETENFRVLIDTFPVLAGHLMISSKKHFGSAGEIPLEMQDELLDLKEHVKKKVQRISGECIFYEHGRSGCCMSINPHENKCEHFHLHCLPLDISITGNLIKKFHRIEMFNYLKFHIYLINMEITYSSKKILEKCHFSPLLMKKWNLIFCALLYATPKEYPIGQIGKVIKNMNYSKKVMRLWMRSCTKMRRFFQNDDLLR